MKHKLLIAMVVTLPWLMSGCVGAIFGGAAVAGGAAFATLHDRRTPGTVVDDKNTDILIERKLSADKSIKDNSHINSNVFNGVVLLTGEAASRALAQRIINVVKTVPNIKQVKSAILIGPSSTLLNRAADSSIDAKVKTAIALLDLPKFDSTLVDVITERGHVNLMGLVTRAEADAVINQTRRVSGVKSVTPWFEYID